MTCTACLLHRVVDIVDELVKRLRTMYNIFRVGIRNKAHVTYFVGALGLQVVVGRDYVNILGLDI